ncbi:MAG: DMT family transporter [Bauldia sp.]|nr:DMT family transporter [Bauldia sp.]
MSNPVTPDVFRGIVLIILSAAVFALVDALSKLLADTQSVWQIVWARYAVALPILLLMTPPAERRALLRTPHPWRQIARGLAPLGVSSTMVLGVRHLPLAEATVILFASPFAIVALAGPLLGERVRPSSWIGVVVGFTAVLIVARPGLGHVSYYALFPLAAAAFYTLYQLLTRQLATLGERPFTTLIWTLATGTVISTPLAVVTWQPVTTTAWGLIVALGLVFALAQALMISAYVNAPAGVLAPFSYVQIVSATGLGILIFHAVPDLWTLLGVVMIIGAGVFVAHMQRRPDPQT